MSASAEETYFEQRQAFDYQELGTGFASTEPLLSEAYYGAESEAVFRHYWLNVGRVEDITEPGDYFVNDLAVAARQCRSCAPPTTRSRHTKTCAVTALTRDAV